MKKYSISSGLLVDLRRELQKGLPLVQKPYAEIASRFNVSEEEVLSAVDVLNSQGIIKRLGLVVRHRELGFVHNGMVVWDIPSDNVNYLGGVFAKEPKITLCYQRARRDGWPYNVYCMIHGKSRESVISVVNRLVSEYGLENVAHEILFSTQRFKQRGGLYV